MMSICQSAIVCKSLGQDAVAQRARVRVCPFNQLVLGTVPAGENPYKVDSNLIKMRSKLLQRYLKDEQKELQALYALQALMVQMEQPASELTQFNLGRMGSTRPQADAVSLSLRSAARVFRHPLRRGRDQRGGLLQVGVQQRPRRAAGQGRGPQVRHRLLHVAPRGRGRVRQQLERSEGGRTWGFRRV